MNEKANKITLASKVEDPAAIAFIASYAFLFNTVLHKFWREFVIKEGCLNEIKSSFQRTYEINARMLNSINIVTKMKWKARKSQYARTAIDYNCKINRLADWIRRKEKEIEQNLKKIEKVEDYRQRKTAYAANPKGRRPFLTKSLKSIDVAVAKAQTELLRDKIKFKEMKVRTLKGKRNHILTRVKKMSMCFGGEALEKKQNHLEQTEFDSLEEHRSFINIQKYGSLYCIGASCETAGNLNAKFDEKNSCFHVKVPKGLGMDQDSIVVPVSFPEHQLELLLANQKLKKQVNVRLFSKARRTRSGALIKIFEDGVFAGYEQDTYCHVTIDAPPAAELRTYRDFGLIGLDLNKDHIALVETDSSGNPIRAYNYPLLDKEGTSNQRVAVLGDHIATICEVAMYTGKSIVIEDLEFEQKKKHLKLAGKGPAYNHMLSTFSFSKFKTALTSRAKKVGVEVFAVNPAYTSIIGACKFAGYKNLTNHQRAALVIARRGRQHSERSKVYLGPSPAVSRGATVCQNTCLDLVRDHVGPKDTWRVHATKIRELIRDEWQPLSCDKTPINPSRPSGMTAYLRTFEDRRLSCRNSIYRVLSEWEVRGGAPPVFV